MKYGLLRPRSPQRDVFVSLSDTRLCPVEMAKRIDVLFGVDILGAQGTLQYVGFRYPHTARKGWWGKYYPLYRSEIWLFRLIHIR